MQSQQAENQAEGISWLKIVLYGTALAAAITYAYSILQPKDDSNTPLSPATPETPH